MITVYRCNSAAKLPTYSTQYAACFDLSACLTSGARIQAIIPEDLPHFGDSSIRQEFSREIVVSDDLLVVIPPGGRALIPTGLKFNIPPKCSLRLHPRSGASFKKGLFLSNCEGVIDEDYVDEVLVSVCNASAVPLVITHLERICQAELVYDTRSQIIETFDEIAKKGNRLGGFGSTGS